MLLRKRMKSKKLLLKQREAAEAFAFRRDAYVSFQRATVRTFATNAP